MFGEILRVCMLFTVVAVNVESARILGIFPGPTKSHFVMFGPVMRELAARGHEVDVVSHFPLGEPLPRYRDLSVKGSMPLLYLDGLGIEAVRAIGGMDNILDLILRIFGTEQCETMFQHPVFKELLHTNRTYDAVITETFGTECMLGFGYRFGIPNIVLTSSVGHPWANDFLGNPDNPSYIPNYYSPFTGALNFCDRFINTLINIKTKLMYKYYSDIPSNRIAKEFFGQDLPELFDLANNVSLALVNSHYSINGARPMVPNYIEVGGLHVGKSKPVPKELHEFLSDKDGRGVIYFSLGTIILAETFEHKKLQGFFDTFAELSKDYKVLWKAVRSKFPATLTIPDNVKFIHWIPQLDVLCHPNVKVFITHGGLMGSQEAVHCGTPMIGMPMFADQRQNVNSYARLGILVPLEYDDITRESVQKSLKDILYNKSYATNAALVSQLFRDRPMSAIDTAMFWIDHVVKYGKVATSDVDALRLIRSPAADLYWYQYYLLDVMTAMVLLVVVAVYVVVFVGKYLCRRLCRCRSADINKKTK